LLRNCFAGPEAAHWQKYPLTAVNSCLAGPNICQVKPAAHQYLDASQGA
jgi:hypothetical protein